MSHFELLLYGQMGTSIMMFVAWIHAIIIKNTSYVDVLWGYGVGILGFIFIILAGEDCDPARLALLKALLVTWSARLGTYLFRRCLGKPEDARYAYLREWMGKKANFGFFIFFQIQAFWVVLFASPFLVLAKNPNPINTLDQIGLIIWLIGFCGVHLADKQLKIFKSQPNRSRSDVCNTGLWKYSRHPNYFFEWILWTGYIFIGWQAPLGEWLLVIPLILYIFLTKITGVPFVEARKLEASGEEYKLYIEQTNSFFPGVPKNQS
jgi:steroid 5-alpha reductase family enzyme